MPETLQLADGKIQFAGEFQHELRGISKAIELLNRLLESGAAGFSLALNDRKVALSAFTSFIFSEAV